MTIDRFTLFAIMVNVVGIINTLFFYYILSPREARRRKNIIGFLICLFLINRALLEVTAYAWGLVLLQDIVLSVGLVIGYAFYVYRIRLGGEELMKIGVVAMVVAWTILRSMEWRGGLAFILFYTISATIYYLLWRHDSLGLYTLKMLFSLSFISDMRELVYTVHNHIAHWIFHVKPILWIFIIPLIPDYITRSKKRLITAILLTILANYLDYASCHWLWILPKTLTPEGSALFVRLIITPTPILLLENENKE